MVDGRNTDYLIDEISKYLRPPETYPILIFSNQVITLKFIDFLRKQKSRELVIIKKMFEKKDSYPYLKWKWEHVCVSCSKVHIIESSKDVFFDNLSELKNKKYPDKKICQECETKQKEEYEASSKIREEKIKEEIENQTNYFIANFLSINDKNIYKFYNFKCRYQEHIDKKKIIYFVNNMGYKNFLTTSYWRTIAYHVKKKANFECQLCSSRNNLNVHHKSYRNLGNEMWDLSDLICLCSDCHSTFHHKI